MISIKSATLLCVAIVFFNFNQYDTKTVDKDSDKATNTTTEAITNSTTTPSPSLVNRFLDIDSMIHGFFPNFNFGGGIPGNFQNYPNNVNQVSNPQGNNWNNGNWDAAIHYPDSPQNYPGQNVQGSNPQYPGNDFNNFNGGNYPVNPNTPQQNYPQYPGAGSNLDNNNNWNNNEYPVNYQNRPSYPNEQGLYPGSENGLNNINGLQNNQNSNRIVFPNDQVPMQGVPQGQAPGLNQGQPQDPQETFQNGNPGLQNGGSFNPQDSNGLNNLPNVNLQRPLLQYPLTNEPDVITEKVAILGLPVTVSNETTQKPLVNASTSSAMKQCVQDCPSTSEYNPVCGSNNITYFNEGKMECARFCGIDVVTQRNGACTTDPTPGIFG
ncbi:putative mediator of RNA polymerase II transcription subunit 26 isoform X4 [Maniola jurtina]|uniref:putative mediator of RNA polymerase II transcription subunit 26 isoform X4 n=1 Tax=Maniola jurtina TaxID=191418 RepID=UPI001E68BFE1|nr:putative mediator of RNA polymerase II transcription subunit 26 isoform X4 [Maniola jurtina]